MGSQEAPSPPAMATKPRFIFFTDFDGTVTQQDSNDLLTDTLGFGVELRRQGNRDVLEGRRAFRDSFEEMMDSVSATTGFADCIATLRRNIALDPHFAEFFAWARDYNVPIVVLSGGMRPIIQALLGSLLGESEAETMQIVSNNVAPRVDGGDINVPGGWQIVFRDDSPFGHDKSIEIRKYSTLPDGERPVLFYAGDGVSDLSAAKETDLLFAKAGRDLVTYCEKEGVPFATFESFAEILTTVKDIVAGNLSVKDAAKGRR